MGSKLELIGINERNGLVTPNLYKQNWLIPSNTTNNYGVLHTRALSDTTTPIYGKGTGKFLDTSNGGGSYDINGSINYVGSGRLNAISINTAQWSYGPATPYDVKNTRALSDIATPVYGKGTGIFLDTSNGGGSYDINGNQTKFPGSGRVPLMNNNYAIWGFGEPYVQNYKVQHPHALSPIITPKASDRLTSEGTVRTEEENGKGTLDSTDLNNINSFILPAHTNYAGGGRDDIISRERIIRNPYNLYWVNTKAPGSKDNWYTVSHPNAKAPTKTPSASDILTSEGSLSGDTKGKGTGDVMGLDGTLAAHTNYAGGSTDDIISRKRNIEKFGNQYRVSSSEYDMSHVNAKADGDTKGKGTGDGISLDGTYAAHTNYAGGSSVDISGNQSKFLGSGRDASNKSNETNVQPTITITKGVVSIGGTSKPFGYGFTTGKDYITTKPVCSDTTNTTNVGTIKWP